MNEDQGVITTNSGLYQCLKCLKVMTQKGHAKRHYRNLHLKPIVVSCEYCPKVFKNKDSHNKHLKTAHGVTERLLKYGLVPSEDSQNSQ